jgi:GH25 family lysozyme M1 (1,4-beta-N-acetylmuramidase)
MGEVQGIDVSHYQGLIDWAKVKKDGKEFAIMKCQYEAQSHRIDETFEYNYKKFAENIPTL